MWKYLPGEAMHKIDLILIMWLSFNQSFGLAVNITKILSSTDPNRLYKVNNFNKKFQLKISEECAKLDFCDKVLNFPEDEITKLIALLVADKVNFNLDLESEENVEDDGITLCPSESAILRPRLTRVADVWHIVLNSENNIVQSFRTEKCLENNSRCSDIVYFSSSFGGSCLQKYIKRPMIALNPNNDEVIALPREVPSCCTCMAFKKGR